MLLKKSVLSTDNRQCYLQQMAVAFLLLTLQCLPPLAAVDLKDARSVSLAEAQSLALEGNAGLISSALSLEAARRSSQSRWNAFLPNISLNGGVSNSHEFTGGAASGWSWNATAGLSLSLTAGIPVQMQLAALGYEVAYASHRLQLQTVMTSVASSYYNLVAEAQNLGVLEDNLELTRQQYQQARRDYNSGLVPELDMLRAQYAYVSSEPALERARNQYQANLAAFQILVGSPVTVVPIGGFQLQELRLPPGEELVEGYLERRLDVIQRRLALRQAELSRTSQNLAARSPSVNLSESFRMGPEGGSMAGGPLVSGGFSVSVAIPVDGFIPGSSRSLSLQQAGDAVDIARLQLDTALAEGRQDIVSRVSEIGILWHAIELASLNQSIAQRAHQLSLEGYRAGLVSQTDLEDSRQQMVAAQLAVGTSQSQYLVGVGNLANALGLEFGEVYALFGVKE